MNKSALRFRLTTETDTYRVLTLNAATTASATTGRSSVCGDAAIAAATVSISHRGTRHAGAGRFVTGPCSSTATHFTHSAAAATAGSVVMVVAVAGGARRTANHRHAVAATAAAAASLMFAVAAAAAAAAATAIAAEDEEEPVGLPAAATDMAADRGAAAIDIGMGISTDASEDALLLLVMVFVSGGPYSPIEPSRCPQVGQASAGLSLPDSRRRSGGLVERLVAKKKKASRNEKNSHTECPTDVTHRATTGNRDT
uniref:Uncharacterized protein n=1 Tax=Anopheles atroparvus TaxID=41427 RepID=A0A182IX13_ANOAO